MAIQQIWTTSMHKNNDLYICRVCGAEQLQRPLGVMMENHQHMKYVIAVGLNSVTKIQHCKELRNIDKMVRRWS
ncbi:hypothetical protein NDX98_22685 [Enterobacter roggenkampii]